MATILLLAAQAAAFRVGAIAPAAPTPATAFRARAITLSENVEPAVEPPSTAVSEVKRLGLWGREDEAPECC